MFSKIVVVTVSLINVSLLVFFITHHLNVDNKAYAINNPNCLVTFIKRYMKLSLLQTYHHILFLASVVYIHEDSDQSRCHTHHLLCTDHTGWYSCCRSGVGNKLYIKKQKNPNDIKNMSKLRTISL